MAEGKNGTDAINVSQLRSTANHLAGKINKVDLVAVGGGSYCGESGVALGMSSISDGGNWILKTTANADSRGNFGVGAAIGYQW